MKIELEGYNLDELIKVLYRKKITLINLQKVKDNHIIFEIEDKDHKKVKKYILNYKTKTILGKFRQLPKLMLANLGIILGVFFGSIFMLFASAFTWQICVYGTEELTYSEIITVLANNGIKKGKINHASSEEIETILLNNYNRIAQVSVIKQGTAIIINLSEKLVYNSTEYEPITAKFNGIVTETHILTGTTNVKVGDYVNVGDVLVLPFNILPNGERVSVKPMAEIKAKIFVVGTCSLSKTEQCLTRTGKTIVTYNYQLFNFNLFLYKYGKGIKKKLLMLLEKIKCLPCEFEKHTQDVIINLENYAANLDEEQRTKLLNRLIEIFGHKCKELVQKARQLAQSKLPTDCTLLDESSSVSVVEDTMYASTTFTIIGVVN